MAHLDKFSTLLIVVGLVGCLASTLVPALIGYRSEVVSSATRYGSLAWTILVIGLVIACGPVVRRFISSRKK